jgi:protein phosphatase
MSTNATGTPTTTSGPALAAGNGAVPAAAETVTTPICQACRAVLAVGATYCPDCGCVYDPASTSGNGVANSSAPRKVKNDRYELLQLLTQREEVSRYRGLDHGAGTPTPIPVFILRAPQAAGADPVVAAEVVADAAPATDEEIMPVFEDAAAVPTENSAPPWPSIAWERHVLQKAHHPGLPAILDNFIEDGYEYMVEEIPGGLSLWDAWDDPTANSPKRFGWLKQAAQILSALHQCDALVESVRPDQFVLAPDGQVRLIDLSDMLTLPLPPNPPIRATLYTAPELILATENVTARANLYSFGAMVFSLMLGRELVEKDFERQGVPKPILPLFPDIHPSLGRLLAKTFNRDVDWRFPTDEAAKKDPTGFAELIHTLDVCGRTLDNCHLEIAAWTTIGMVRTGNEDAFALVHAMESSVDDIGESALIINCDGMGGYDAGEVASAMAIRGLRRILLGHKMFSHLAGESPLVDQEPFDLEKCKKYIYEALKQVNTEIFTAPQKGIGKRGMGCTADVVYVNGQNVVVGHVGDSRVYHLQQGNLVQITRDQTLVNRLVELGQITPEEAEHHPRRSELQQAIGGRSQVEPALYSAPLKPGDWVLICTDGLTNHITPDELRNMMAQEAMSAETAARRLINFVNIKGATDNSNAIVIRAM